jgi:hypothetical protein
MMSFDLILDIDGVLIAYPDGPTTRPDYFTPSCVDALKLILNKLPAVRVIFSTTMKDTRKGREKLMRMWLSAGLPEERIAGETIACGNLGGNRSAELRQYFEDNYQNTMIPVDDELLYGIKYVKVNAFEGLTLLLAEQIISLFKGSNLFMNPKETGIGWSYLEDPQKFL